MSGAQKPNASPRVFILGAGFSHHLSGGKFPLTCDLTKMLLDKIDLPGFKNNIQDSDVEKGVDIEAVLSRVQLDSDLSDVHKKEIEDEIFDVLQENLSVMSIYESDEKHNTTVIENAKSLVKGLFKDGDIIVTLNYDLLLEHVLSSTHDWTPYKGGYGGISFFDSGEENKSGISIFKVHGSLNYFSYAPKKAREYISVPIHASFDQQVIRDLNEMQGQNGNPWLFESLKNERTFLTVDASHEIDEKQAVQLILPSYIKPFAKNRSFARMYFHLWDIFRKTRNLNIIGCNCREEDWLIAAMFSNIGYIETNSNEENKKDWEENPLKVNIINVCSKLTAFEEQINLMVGLNPREHIRYEHYCVCPNCRSSEPYEKFIKDNS